MTGIPLCGWTQTLKQIHMKISENIKKLITLSLEEDIGNGDITTRATISESTTGKGFVKAKSAGILCGQQIFDEVFRQVDVSVRLDWLCNDGQPLALNEQCVTFEGSMRAILTAERTALNFLQRMSGIATLTHQYVELTRHTPVKIIDTRKTTPIWREFEKYAVRTGGGFNHRMGLYDMFLIKDNHITASGGISSAIQNVLRYNVKFKLHCGVEVETKNLNEVKEALEFPVQRIMLDNMSPDEMKEAVKLVDHRCEVEASGGVSLSTVRTIAETGVDFISVGALTHSAPAMDLSLLVENV